jgi:neutral ceramidase
MKRRSLRYLIPELLLACLVTFVYTVNAGPAAKNSLQVGTAKIKITPTTPIPMSGYGGRNDPFKGVHDDLYARAIVFSDGVNKAATITCELVGLSNAVWDEVTSRVEKETGIKKDFILLSCIHTHSGPTTNVYNDGNTPAVAAYVEELKGKLVDAVKEANGKLADAKIGAGKGECLMNMSRRAMDGKGNVSLGLNPYAACDHEVGVIRIDDKSDQHIALMVDWPCHAVVLGPRNYQLTNDWPGAASKFVEKGLGANVVAPIIIGASGDINPLYGPHIDFENNSSYAFGKDAIGEDLANVSMAVMKDIKTSPAASISAVQRVISIEAKARDNSRGLQPDRKDDDTLKVRLSAVKIGNIVLTGVSGEVFNQISVQMRKQSPYKNTFMITHCNGSSGYLVTEDAYPTATQKGYEDKYHPKGGYEPGSTRAKTGAEKAIIENLLAMIKELK